MTSDRVMCQTPISMKQLTLPVLLVSLVAVLILTGCAAPAVDEPPTSAPAANTMTSPTATSSRPTATPAPGAPPTRYPAERYEDLEIVTLLPPDAIPAIDNPRFLAAEAAGELYEPDELVIGVAFGDEARAYSVPFLSRHEIVNDEVGGVKIAVTW